MSCNVEALYLHKLRFTRALLSVLLSALILQRVYAYMCKQSKHIHEQAYINLVWRWFESRFNWTWPSRLNKLIISSKYLQVVSSRGQTWTHEDILALIRIWSDSAIFSRGCMAHRGWLIFEAMLLDDFVLLALTENRSIVTPNASVHHQMLANNRTLLTVKCR